VNDIGGGQKVPEGNTQKPKAKKSTIRRKTEEVQSRRKTIVALGHEKRGNTRAQEQTEDLDLHGFDGWSPLDVTRSEGRSQ